MILEVINVQLTAERVVMRTWYMAMDGVYFRETRKIIEVNSNKPPFLKICVFSNYMKTTQCLEVRKLMFGTLSLLRSAPQSWHRASPHYGSSKTQHARLYAKADGEAILKGLQSIFSGAGDDRVSAHLAGPWLFSNFHEQEWQLCQFVNLSTWIGVAGPSELRQ